MNLTNDTIITNYTTEVALGHVKNTSIVNKFGYNTDIDSTSGYKIIASFGGAYNPLTMVIDTLQTFTITYNNATDGLGTTGALSLIITYLDTNFLEVTAFHTLGNTGSDVTSFSGYGINRCVVYSNGGVGTNTNNIDITATTDTTIQARVPSLKSVTQQCIYHVQQGYSFLCDGVQISTLKLNGGGGNSHRVSVRGFSYSRVTNTIYQIYYKEIDTAVENNLTFVFPKPFVFTGREVIYFTADTDKDNTSVSLRFSGITTKS